ncbi:MAG TPA: 5'/3'-nucleotidase SurE, partial [Planctomycetaceae bacterium]|nr:5'/3'-nucleotidase SurE [Planctomycetaceae bacterium]
INSGLNAGINVLYSGTVAAAIEGAVFGITSMAVSLEYTEHAHFDRAAELAIEVIRQVLEKKGPEPHLYNLNIPLAALDAACELRIVPMGVARYGESFERRVDPRGRNYYWATNDPPPPPSEGETDLTALSKGHMTLTPLDFDMTRHDLLREMRDWRLVAPAAK